MSALCVEGSGVADAALEELQLSRDTSKGKGILRLFMPAHGTACCWKSLSLLEELGHTIDNSKDLGCHSYEVSRNSLQALSLCFDNTDMITQLLCPWVAQWTPLHGVFALHCAENLPGIWDNGVGLCLNLDPGVCRLLEPKNTDTIQTG